MKELFFIFDKTLYKQLDGVAIASPLGLTLAYSFLCCHEKDVQISAQRYSNQCFTGDIWKLFL